MNIIAYKKAYLAVALTAALALLAACGGGAASAPTTSPATAEAPATPPVLPSTGQQLPQASATSFAADTAEPATTTQAPTATQAPSAPTATQAPAPAATPVPTAAPAGNAGSAGGQQPAPTPAANSPQAAFIQQIVPYAQAEQADSGVPAAFSIALAAAETGWGASPLMKQHNNYHMISCSQPNQGLPCVAYGNGMWNAYSSPQQAFLWHGRWMRARPEFAPAFQHTDDVATFTHLVAQCYVSCSGPYPQAFYDGIMRIVDQYNLRQYDAKH